MNRKIVSIFITGVAMVIMSSCSFTKGKQTAERAVAQFHDQFNAGQYNDIYQQADEGFRKVTSEKDALALFEAVHRKLGTVKNTSQDGWRMNATTRGTQVSLVYKTEFTEGNATEQFIFFVSGDNARLFGYNINSSLLVTR